MILTFSCRVYRQVGVNQGGQITEKVFQEEQGVLGEEEMQTVKPQYTPVFCQWSSCVNSNYVEK